MTLNTLLITITAIAAVIMAAGCDSVNPAEDDCLEGCAKYAASCSSTADLQDCEDLCYLSVGEMAGNCVDDFRTGNLAANMTAECNDAFACLAAARKKSEF